MEMSKEMSRNVSKSRVDVSRLKTADDIDAGATAEFYIKLARQLAAEADEYLCQANKENSGSEAEIRFLEYYERARSNADDAALQAMRAIRRFQDDLYSKLF